MVNPMADFCFMAAQDPLFSLVADLPRICFTIVYMDDLLVAATLKGVINAQQVVEIFGPGIPKVAKHHTCWAVGRNKTSGQWGINENSKRIVGHNDVQIDLKKKTQASNNDDN